MLFREHRLSLAVLLSLTIGQVMGGETGIIHAGIVTSVPVPNTDGILVSECLLLLSFVVLCLKCWYCPLTTLCPVLSEVDG